MKSEGKIILIGASITLVTLILAIFFFYFFATNAEENNVFNESNSNSSTNDIENEVSTNKKITLYLFRGSGCPHCEEAMEFLKSILDEYPYLEVQTIEVWHNKNNKELMDAVSKNLDIEVSSSVPFIVIGDEYAKRGFADGMENTLKKQIEKAYQSADYKDVVKETLENNSDIRVNVEILKN